MLVPKEKQMFLKNKFWAGIFLSAITTIVAAQTDPIILEKIVDDVERSSKQSQREQDRDLRELRREIDAKIQKALDNPLAGK
jgi:hypothetical protein